VIIHSNPKSSENLKRNSDVRNLHKVCVKLIDKIFENFHETRSLHLLGVGLVVRDLHGVETIFNVTHLSNVKKIFLSSFSPLFGRTIVLFKTLFELFILAFLSFFFR